MTSYMQSDLDKAIKLQPLTDDQVQLLVYQIFRGLKVTMTIVITTPIIKRLFFSITVHPFCWSIAQSKGY